MSAIAFHSQDANNLTVSLEKPRTIRGAHEGAWSKEGVLRCWLFDGRSAGEIAVLSIELFNFTNKILYHEFCVQHMHMSIRILVTQAHKLCKIG